MKYATLRYQFTLHINIVLQGEIKKYIFLFDIQKKSHPGGVPETKLYIFFGLKPPTPPVRDILGSLLKQFVHGAESEYS